MNHVCYFYEDRIPHGLRDLVRISLKEQSLTFNECTYSSTDHEIIEKISDSETVLFAPGRFLSDEILSHASHIRLMQIWSSGYDKFNLEGAKKFGIPVANNGGANAISVAEHTLLLMLGVSRKLVEMNFRACSGNWAGNSHGLDMYSLNRKVLGIVGLGNIGHEVAIRANAMGMRIQYYDVRDRSSAAQAYAGKAVSLEDLFLTSDYISIHCHHNKLTDRMITSELLKSTKRGAFFINVSRSQLVDIDTLYKLACSRHLGGVGLDVYESEPTSGYEPLLGLPSVLATPHTAGSTIDTYKNALQRCIDNIKGSLNNQEILWQV